MKNIETRLDQIEAKITNDDFLKNKGLGNEVGYYIFDYAPQNELKVRQHIAYLKAKMSSIFFVHWIWNMSIAILPSKFLTTQT